jgi:hypothetical protein
VYGVALDNLHYPDNEYLNGFVNYLEETLPKGSTVVGYVLWEFTNPKKWAGIIDTIAEKFNLVLVLDSVYRPYHECFQNIKDVVYVDFLILRAYYEIYIRKISKLNTSWNPNTDKFLFLTGKPNRAHRVGLLYKFWKRNLLDHATWSAFIDEENFDSCRPFIPVEGQDEFKSWLNLTWHSPDNIRPWKMNNNTHYGGFPYDPALYTNTCFRVIAETHMDRDFPWVTEKTYITILNKHPFIIAGDRGVLKDLNSKGFRTFEKYLLIQDYDMLATPAERIDAVVKNTEYLLTTFKSRAQEINEDTEYNFRVFHDKVEPNFQILKEMANRVGCSEYNINVILPFWDGLVDHWTTFYYNIKDDSWPDCYNEDKFRELPEHIQKECIEVFGYRPRN